MKLFRWYRASSCRSGRTPLAAPAGRGMLALWQLRLFISCTRSAALSPVPRISPTVVMLLYMSSRLFGAVTKTVIFCSFKIFVNVSSCEAVETKTTCGCKRDNALDVRRQRVAYLLDRLGFRRIIAERRHADQLFPAADREDYFGQIRCQRDNAVDLFGDLHRPSQIVCKISSFYLNRWAAQPVDNTRTQTLKSATRRTKLSLYKNELSSEETKMPCFSCPNT